MQRVTLICVGKLKENYWREACAEYQKRLQPFCRLELIEVEEERVADNPSPAQIAQTLREEGRRILAKVPEGAAVLPLCIEGKSMSSETFAQRLEDLAVNGVSSVVLIIGGSWGLAEEVKRAGSRSVSMSAMTFPHQLARVMLLEQLYRAFQIRSGGKYHK